MSPTSAIRSFARFPSIVRWLLLGVFIVRFTYFMAWPFLAIILYRDLGLSPSEIGALLTVASLAAFGVGFYLGNRSDSSGRKGIILLGCALGFFGYGCLGLAHSVAWYGVGIFLSCISYALIDPPGRAIIHDVLGDPKQHELALHFRYFLLNVSAALGPLLGIALGLTARQPTFLLTALSYCLLAGVLIQQFRGLAKHRPHAQATPSFAGIVRIVGRDRVFSALLLANLLVYVIYAQFEATMAQYLHHLGKTDAVSMLTLMLVVNAATVLLVQFPLLRAMQNMALAQRVVIGTLLFAASQLLFSFGASAGTAHWVVATIVFSVGEAILLPTFNVQIDRLAPAAHRGAYLGASSFAVTGLALGPLAGGLMLEAWGAGVYTAMAGLALLVGAIQLLVQAVNRERPSPLPANTGS